LKIDVPHQPANRCISIDPVSLSLPELGYSISHAYGAVFDNPDLISVVVVGDGEAETGPLATAWHSNKFLDPRRDGAVLPILHLNGYKINNPTILARISHQELERLLQGYGYTPYFVEGDDPDIMHQLMAATLDRAIQDIHTLLLIHWAYLCGISFGLIPIIFGYLGQMRQLLISFRQYMRRRKKCGGVSTCQKTLTGLNWRLLAIANQCFKSTNQINVIVSDKQPHLQYLTIDAAIAHRTKGKRERKY
jgi:XFP N-terminal domain